MLFLGDNTLRKKCLKRTIRNRILHGKYDFKVPFLWINESILYLRQGQNFAKSSPQFLVVLVNKL